MGRIPEGALITHENGKVTREGKSPSIGYLWPHHRLMARMALTGSRPEEIAVATGFSSGQISRILGSPAFQSELIRLENEADDISLNMHEEIQKIATRAIEVLDRNVQMIPQSDKDKALQQTAAFDILDRAGFGKKEVHINKNLSITGTLREIKEMTTEDLREDIANLIEVD